MAFALPAIAAFAPETAAALGASSTFATISSIGQIVGLAGSAFGAIQGGRAQAASDKYAASVAANNAQIARDNATRTAQEGDANAEKKQLETRAKLGGLLADQGASGVDVNSGSAVDVRSSAAETGALDALTIRSNAARQAYGYQTDAAGFDAESSMKNAAAKDDSTAGLIKSGSTFLTGLSSLGNSGALTPSDPYKDLVGSKSISKYVYGGVGF